MPTPETPRSRSAVHPVEAPGDPCRWPTRYGKSFIRHRPRQGRQNTGRDFGEALVDGHTRPGAAPPAEPGSPGRSAAAGHHTPVSASFQRCVLACSVIRHYLRTDGDGDSDLNEALHWNGTRRSKVSAPDPGGTADGDASWLLAARCVTRGNCWAVGSQAENGGADKNQVLHWNGTRWSAGNTHLAPAGLVARTLIRPPRPLRTQVRSVW